MYHAKALGKSRHQVFDSSMHARARKLLQLEHDLRRAIDRREFRVHYQPIVRVADRRIAGFEALARWQHPERGLVAPSEFIHLAEKTGLVVPLGRAVLEEACKQAVACRPRPARTSPSASTSPSSSSASPTSSRT
jgi:predicted signal transduction protein with EAL and GGDEF domain